MISQAARQIVVTIGMTMMSNTGSGHVAASIDMGPESSPHQRPTSSSQLMFPVKVQRIHDESMPYPLDAGLYFDTVKVLRYERALLRDASSRPQLGTGRTTASSMTGMAQHERHRDQRDNDEDARGQEMPGRAARSPLLEPLPGAPPTSPTTSLPLRPRRHLLTLRQLVEHRKTPRKLGVRYGDLVRYATQRSLLPCAQAHGRHLRLVMPGRCRSLALPLLSPATSSRQPNGVNPSSHSSPSTAA